MDLRALFLRQGIMRRVVISLLPILLFAVYSFGLRILVLLAVVTIAGVLTEYLILRFMKGNAKFKIPEAIFVTCILFTLILPSTVPFWVAVVGIAFGVLFGKGVFGGFGKNIFNPALVGRCFVFISFPSSMTVTWATPFQGFPGGFVRYSTAVDSISAATPLVQAGGDLLRLLLGQISGSSGEISALLIVLAAVYLVVTKTASWRIMVSCVLGFIGVSTVFYLAGAASTPWLLLTGGFLFSAVFMAHRSHLRSPRQIGPGHFGVLVGMLAITIRTFSVFREGAMFAILLGNAFGPLIQMKVKQWKQRRMVVSER